jgi:hypothetical protein
MTILSKELIGNEVILDQLILNFRNNTLSNSIIFSGSKGIGKATLAFYFINKIFEDLSSVNKNKNHSNYIYNFTHPNIRYIEKEFDEKTNKYRSSISIERIRNLENFLYQSSLNNLPKFIIIDAADDLNKNSGNSLLKILEEPKKETYFILIAHQLSSILPTIRSRCIKFNIEKPNFENFTKIINLNDNIIDSENINFLFNLCNSSPGLAIDIHSEKIHDIYNNIIEIIINKKPFSSSVVSLSNVVGKFSNHEFKIFLILLRFILITMIKINLGYNFLNKLSSKYFEYIIEASNIVKNTVSIEMIEYLNKNENDLFAYNLDKKIFFLNIFTPLYNDE